ncbi:MAG: bifunctional diaminohydroxyphosphoribosylaminopyrimidine deaminase/5-amino-6-(5-phosphoribosylamino)uracil reductase RibD [Hyphomicrobiaceae bacterium]
MDLSDTDERLMSIAMRLGQRGLGTTAPNPAVGAVVHDCSSDRIVARGWTQPGGRPHAEPMALQSAGSAANGSTLYVTLEPCSHHGQTPPCVDAIVASGIRRVVCGIEDPDPRVAGRGLARLRAAGISVTRGVLRSACHYLTFGHILRVTERRPFTQLKLALATDGSVPRGRRGEPTWVSGPAAIAQGHLLRALSDAILVGSGTIRDDNPTLTCRLPGLERRSPVRVVLSGQSEQHLAASNLSSNAIAPTLWVAAPGQARAFEELYGKGQVIRVPRVAGQLWIPTIMEELVARGVTRLLVEGGPKVWSAFDRAGFVDEAVLFVARDRTGQSLSGRDAERLLRGHLPRANLHLVDRRRLDQDDMLVFRRRVSQHLV